MEQLQGEECATLEKPPNHKLFNAPSSRLSPVLQCHLELQKPAPAPVAPAAPVFNFSIGHEVIDFFRLVATTPAPVVMVTTPVVTPVAVSAIAPLYDLDCPRLLQPSRLPGQDMPLAQFCMQYNLAQGVLDKLVENSYTQAQTLRFITILELKEMKFKLGEIAALHKVVDMWLVT